MSNDHPWTTYKAALSAVAEAAARVEEAQARNAPDLAEAERAFRDALQSYADAREARGALMDGVPSRMVPASTIRSAIELDRSSTQSA